MLIALLALTMRLPGLGSFMTADEENWMLRSGEFWYKLFQQDDPSGTFLTTHPGATVMWLAGAGIQWHERQLGLGVDTSNIAQFRLAALYPVVIAIAALTGLAAALLIPLLGARAALLSGLFLAVEPYLAGMSQVVHLDMLLALCMLIAVFFFLQFQRTGKKYMLLYGGIFAGLALATKLLPALWLVVGLGFFALIAVRRPYIDGLFKAIAPVTFLSAIAVLTLALVWPALWSQPDIKRYFQQDTVDVATQEHVAYESFEVTEAPAASPTFYARTVLGRVTPITLALGVTALLFAAVAAWRTRVQPGLAIGPAQTIAWLFLYAVGFIVLITFVAKKGDRYALPALAVIPILAGWALAIGLAGLKTRLPRLGYAVVVLAMLCAIVAPRWVWGRYAIAYNNAVFDVRPLTQQGWGEGLDAAAAWLNTRPLAREMYVATWYPAVFRPYFIGNTFDLSSRHDSRTAYVVTYRNMHGRGHNDVTTDMLAEFTEKAPEHIINIRGVPYAWIYNTMGSHYFGSHVGELRGDVEVGQTVPINTDTFDSIGIGMSTFSSRANTADVVLHIREDVNAANDVRTVTTNARDIVDGEYHRFAFDPITGTNGKTYYVSLTSPASFEGNAVTVRFNEADLLPGQMLLRRRVLRAGEQNSQFVRPGDIAYELK